VITALIARFWFVQPGRPTVRHPHHMEMEDC
jgi:hypothetical protein